MACHDPEGARRFSPDRNAAPECPAFSSHYDVRGSRWLRALPAPAWVALALLGLLAGITAFIVFIDPDLQLVSGREKLRIQVTLPSEVALGQQFSVDARLDNDSTQWSSRWYLAMEGEFLAKGTSETSMPLPVPETITKDRMGKNLIFEYKPIAPRGWTVVRLFFTPKRAGEFPLVIKLYSPNYQHVREVEARVTVVNTHGQPIGKKEGDTHER